MGPLRRLTAGTWGRGKPSPVFLACFGQYDYMEVCPAKSLDFVFLAQRNSLHKSSTRRQDLLGCWGMEVSHLVFVIVLNCHRGIYHKFVLFIP